MAILLRTERRVMIDTRVGYQDIVALAKFYDVSAVCICK